MTGESGRQAMAVVITNRLRLAGRFAADFDEDRIHAVTTDYREARLMSWKHVHRLVVSGVCLALVVGPTGTAGAEKNVLQNPDFEHVENGLPKGWTRYVGDGHVAGWKEFDPKKHQAITMALSSEEHKTGERSIFMRCDESVICGFGQKLELRGDGIYLFSAWVKCEDLVAAGEGGAIIFEFDAGDEKRKFQYIDLRTLRGTKDWFRVRKLIRTPKAATEMMLCLYGLFNGSGTTWVDDVQFILLK